MENLILAINVVLPLFMLIILGYLLKKMKFYDDKILECLNKLVFKVFLPILLFVNIYNTSLADSFNLSLIVYAVICLLIIYFGTWVIIPFFEKEKKNISVIIQAIYRSNYVLFGIPITAALFGEKSVGVTTILIAIIVPMYNFLAVILLEFYRSSKLNLWNVIKGIITNPLIIGSVLGMICLLFNIKIPYFLEKTTNDISKVATPMALIILGGTFRFSAINNNLKQIIITVLGRNIIVPLIFVSASILRGYRGVELIALVAMFTAPTAVSSYTMAEIMGANGQLAAQNIVFTSICSFVTIFITIYLIKFLNFI